MRFGKRRLVIGIFSLAVVAFGLPLLYTNASRVSTHKTNSWSIGIYTGKTPFDLSDPDSIRNPVLTAAQVTDVKADFVADPFMIRKDSVWYMFFEVLNSLSAQGDIGLAESRDGKEWHYRRIVLNESFHLSYPLVFLHAGEYYMIPESAESGKLMLYRANAFPYNWEMVQVLVEGQFGDHVLFEHEGQWWIIAISEPRTHSTTRLFYADSLKGEYTEHPASPIVRNDASRARPGGRIPLYRGKRYWFAQDCDPTYGRKLNAFRIVKLSRDEYLEEPFDGNPVLEGGHYRWARRGMHHIDAHQVSEREWFACVDGYYRNFILRIEY
ncbi:MAG: glucosamine inositolphosphorylceramide transferase family protein [Fibrobacterota bacterium]